MRQPTGPASGPQRPGLYSQPATPPPPHQFMSPYVIMTQPHPAIQATNLALIFINLAVLLLSIPIFVVGLWLAARHHADCLRNSEWLFIVIGIVMMVVSIIGLVGAWRSKALILWVYICLLTFIILLLLAFTIFAFVVTRGHIVIVEGANMKEYVFGDYSHWMRNKVSNAHSWNKIKSCLVKGQVCSNLHSQYPTQNIMSHRNLFYVESGCCKPPTACGFTFVNATNWVNPRSPGADPDCGRWSNDPLQLCYNCDSCKTGVIHTLNKDWRKAAKVALAVLVALALLYVLAWLAFLQALAYRSAYSTVGAYRR